MKVSKITNGPLSENCYVFEAGGHCFVVDPGLDTEKILAFLKENKLKPEIILLTHGHFDHIFSVKAIKDMGAKVYITEVDAPKLLDNELALGFLIGVDCPSVLPDGFLVEGKNEICGQEFEVIFTPGHTSGSCCIVYKDNIFTGDTYFEEGVYGRCDLLDGDQAKMDKSIEKLRPHLNKKNIFPGHE